MVVKMPILKNDLPLLNSWYGPVQLLDADLTTVWVRKQHHERTSARMSLTRDPF